MKLGQCEAMNFGSYKQIQFSFEDLNLALIHGSTGAGKSTLFDIPCWTLFGITSKNGSVDDVKNWNANEATVVTLTIWLGSQDFIEVIRIRGNPSETDLYWIDYEGIKYRGKDITETQKMLEARLGITADLYLAGSYYSEFSPSAGFFTAKAKDRKELFELIAPLELPIKIEKNIAIQKKLTNQLLSTSTLELASTSADIRQSKKYLGSVKQQAFDWDTKHASKLVDYQTLSDTFEQDQLATINALNQSALRFDQNINHLITGIKQQLEEYKATACPTCKRSDHSKEEQELYNELSIAQNKPNPYTNKAKIEATKENPYSALLAAEQDQFNPFILQIESLKETLQSESDLHESLLKNHAELQSHFDTLVQLNDITSELRLRLLTNAIERIQSDTNRYLSTFFDSEISVAFKLQSSNELQCDILKNTNPCNYKQLSKGQRSLLKLCFALSVMKEVSMNNGTKFSTIFLDEPTDGMDNELKVKAFNLFNELSLNHESVLVIEHSLELKALFHNQYEVTLDNESSKLCITHE